jgi:hypothetical protein
VAREAAGRNSLWFFNLEIEQGLTRIIRVVPAWTVASLATLHGMTAARVIHGFPVRRFLETCGDIFVAGLAGF